MKRITAALLTALLALSLAACSSGKTDTQSTTQPDASATTQTEDGAKKIDFSQMVVGKITKISGNQITIETGKINMDSIEKPENMPEDFDPANRPEKGERPENIPEDFDPENMPEDFDPDNKPEGTGPDSFPGGKPDGSLTAEIEYTGETSRYTIPAEVKVGTGDYTSLSGGMVVALSLDDDGIVTSVMLITEKGTN